MVSQERIQKAITILSQKKSSYLKEEMLNRLGNFNVLEHAPCVSCTLFNILFSRNKKNTTLTVYLRCREGHRPQDLFTREWMPIDPVPTCDDVSKR